jgi:hypothetical protein
MWWKTSRHNTKVQLSTLRSLFKIDIGYANIKS